MGWRAPGVKRNIQILFSTPPETYNVKTPAASACGENTAPTEALCGVGKYTFCTTTGGLAFRSMTASDCCARLVVELNCRPKPLLTAMR